MAKLQGRTNNKQTLLNSSKNKKKKVTNTKKNINEKISITNKEIGAIINSPIKKNKITKKIFAFFGILLVLFLILLPKPKMLTYNSNGSLQTTFLIPADIFHINDNILVDSYVYDDIEYEFNTLTLCSKKIKSLHCQTIINVEEGNALLGYYNFIDLMISNDFKL